MIDKTDEQLNQWITENVMKGCWHENVTDAVFEIGGSHLEVPYWCPKCGIAVDKLYDIVGDSYGFNSTYCTDLNAVARAEAGAWSKIKNTYITCLGEITGVRLAKHCEPYADATFERSDLGQLVTATARQRAEAVYLATGGSDDR